MSRRSSIWTGVRRSIVACLTALLVWLGEGAMEKVTISSKRQVVIPGSIRKALGIRPGDKVHVIPYEDRIELIPMRKARSMRGFLRGIDTQVSRAAVTP